MNGDEQQHSLEKRCKSECPYVQNSAPSLHLATPSKVDVRGLRKFALNEIPADWPLRQVLLAEEFGDVEVMVFLARLPLWLQLCKFRDGSGK